MIHIDYLRSVFTHKKRCNQQLGSVINVILMFISLLHFNIAAISISHQRQNPCWDVKYQLSACAKHFTSIQGTFISLSLAMGLLATRPGWLG